MLKAEYLDNPDVKDFAKWFGAVITGAREICFKYDNANAYRTLRDAWCSYKWPLRANRGPRDSELEFPAKARFELPAQSDLSTNNEVLGRLQCGLRASFAENNSVAAAPWVAAILVWGGVYRERTNKKTGEKTGNKAWLRNNRTEIAQILKVTKNALCGGTDNVAAVTALKFNSGFTKVYSLLLDDFIMYDSRVAAALAWLVLKWWKETDKSGEPPKLLRFMCMRPNEGQKAKHKKLRNPSKKFFRYLGQQPYEHTTSNLRANWVLSCALAHAMQARVTPGNPIRQLRDVEAALFTMGYDLTYA